MRILLFSSVCKPARIYETAIKSYFNQVKCNFELDFCFYNDNIVDQNQFDEFIMTSKKKGVSVELVDMQGDNTIGNSSYQNHNWDYNKIDRIINIKNEAIKYALKNNYDYLFLVDADLVLHPNTVNHLLSLQKDFVFEIFWTLFYGESYYKPNAWDVHSWAYNGPKTILKLSKPGTYIVGGGGACTLLSREILESGLTFNRLISMPFQGEDRHFCTRAQALGYDVWVDTYYPCYHIFTENQVEEAKQWYESGASPSFFSNWLNSNWEKNIKKSFLQDTSFLGRIRRFQYDIRRSFKKNFIDEQ